MGGGVLQLASIGAEDECLIAHPQITFFKVVFRRHTPFSMESIPQKIKGKIAFGRRVSCTIARNGDLVSNCYLEVEMETPTVASATWTNWLGHNLINTVDIEIGGQRIDRHTGEWLHIWNELTCPKGKQAAYKKMIGETNAHGPVHLYIPLQFWFCRNPGLALPLIALQYHEVKINIEFNELKDCCFYMYTGDKVDKVPDLKLGSDTNIYVDYIYLDTDERRRFAQASHEYLIEQLQFTGTETITQSNIKVRMNFNHPVKELIWTIQPDNHVDPNSTKYTRWSSTINLH